MADIKWTRHVQKFYTVSFGFYSGTTDGSNGVNYHEPAIALNSIDLDKTIRTMCGIFAYLNYCVPRTRKEIFETLVKGLRRLEYRGYDSAGIAVDSDKKTTTEDNSKIVLIKKKGKVKALDEELYKKDCMDLEVELDTHFGIAHTRWATHGEPSALNSHPQRSDKNNAFVVIHNGIITNYKELKKYLVSPLPSMYFCSFTISVSRLFWVKPLVMVRDMIRSVIGFQAFCHAKLCL
ncbi:unnamed protein product [Oncorhynchus mykiss]|uniref:glutamine--fructose-6-phosphate transaminase (isomerizing) n=1 Tax=Oncorhynchus mykiss TaxID=8022 RepID=A0A060XYJ1_ONCMY|nr:unnamed protein product [Oncorhynchus mykiss]